MFRIALRSSLVLAAVVAATTVWLQAAPQAVSQKGKVFAPGASGRYRTITARCSAR